MHNITEEEFAHTINRAIKDFISLSKCLSELHPVEIDRPLMGRMLLESSKCEELLDAFGASRNNKWASTRKAVAVAKAFSRIIYNLHHIEQSSLGYQLLPVDGNFPKATRTVRNAISTMLINSSAIVMTIAKKLKLDKNLHDYSSYQFYDTPVTGQLPATKKLTVESKPRETAVYLATQFLYLAEKSSWLGLYRRIDSKEYEACIPDELSEAKLRDLSNSFHNLQSLYDTYLSGSDITTKDTNLPVMRGQITVVFHLLDTAVILIHFYERHAMRPWNTDFKHPFSTNEILLIILEYFMAFADKYIAVAQELCKKILKSYAMEEEIELSIPNYRGFHVRPSTLIAKIATHYGSELRMCLGDTEYDASSPLELFRANEELNRRKRDMISQVIMKHKLIKQSNAHGQNSMKKVLRQLFLDLLEKQLLMFYGNDYSFDDLDLHEKESLEEFIKRAVAFYLALGKIDIISGDKVIFKGDQRVLQDVEILAKNGYGEDKFGNNVVLPLELSYLKF